MKNSFCVASTGGQRGSPEIAAKAARKPAPSAVPPIPRREAAKGAGSHRATAAATTAGSTSPGRRSLSTNICGGAGSRRGLA